MYTLLIIMKFKKKIIFMQKVFLEDLKKINEYLN